MPPNLLQSKLLFPDACWRPDIISGALFLYFHKETIAFPLQPSVSTFMTRADPFDFFSFAESRAPSWLPKLATFRGILNQYRMSLQKTSEILKPLRDNSFKTIMLSYDRGKHGWESAEEIIASSSLPFSEIAKLIDPYSAADELFSHIFFGKFLEIYEANRSDEELRVLAVEQARSETSEPRHVDWQALYEYADKLFGENELDQILTTTYMFRLPFLPAIPAVLLSNAHLVDFLSSLPVELKRSRDQRDTLDLDIIGWEFFRQIVSQKVDPLTEQSVALICRLVEAHPAEIDALARKCLALAQDLSGETNLETLQNRISQHIRANVETEIESLLFIDKAAVNDFLDLVFGDYKSWAAIATLIYSVQEGGPLLTAGGAIGTIATIGSNAVKAAAQRRKKLETSDYALLYRMRT